MSELRCTGCEREQPLWQLEWRCVCGAPLQWVSGAVPDDRARRAGWRYAECLPPVAPAHRIHLGDAPTPLVPGGDGVTYKLELVAASGSFKDRGARVLTGCLLELGVTDAVLDSSGNAGAAMAAHLAAAGIAATVFVPAHASPGKLRQIALYGARVERVEGDRAQVASAAQAGARERGVPYASHLWSPYFIAGTRTFAFELWEQLGRRAPDAIVLAVGSGSLLLGAYEGFDALRCAGLVERVPRLFAVQAEACAPLADAFEHGTGPTAVRPSARSLAEGIMIADPPRGAAVLAAVRASGGGVVRVADPGVARAQAELAARGLLVEPTAAAAQAGLHRLREDGALETADTTVVALTGSGLKTLDTA